MSTDPADHDRLPTKDQPLNAEPRPRLTPVLAVIGLVVAIALVFVVLTVLRYTT